MALVTYRAVTQGGAAPPAAPIHAPLPSLYTSGIIVYGGLAVLPRSLDPVPAVIGWGLVVATFLNLYTPGSANAAAAADAKLGSGLSKTPTPAPGTPNRPGQTGFGAAIVPVNQQTGVAQ
jgi:hypothetical protein